jgi:hypothetical protein
MEYDEAGVAVCPATADVQPVRRRDVVPRRRHRTPPRPRPAPGHRLGPTLFAGVGLGLLGSAAFRTDPVSGYPPGTPDAPSDPTATGAMHNTAALPIFLGIPAAALACAWRFHQAGRRGCGLYSAATGVSTLIGMALFGAGFSQASPLLTDRAGLLQRATIATGFGWLTALSAQALRRSPRPSERSVI